MDSIIQDTRECYITGDTQGLHKHHIYFGNPGRRISEENGFWVWLRWDWHNGAEYGVHFNRDLDLRLKRECQERFEETNSREEFRRLIGKSYL
ncbi:conserved hypothetical protein [uncultured Eubacteriales bacterium]|uniref:Uncharacterized protein n=1 Tax=uncultured Eubacteriales bacterium TaxID=172733 RepID=A0A212J3P1_9FIRM|nr:conserved hypothetical protein [uncultured Eubacteriales bacterium]